MLTAKQHLVAYCMGLEYNRHMPPYPPSPPGADSRPIDSDPIWIMHVHYFWKALGTGMLDMMFSGV